MYIHLADYDNALDCITRAEAQEPDNKDIIGRKAVILKEMGRYDDALAQFNRFITLDPESQIGYYYRGWIEAKTGKTDEAIADFEMAIATNPDFAYAYYDKGNMLMRKGETEKAMEAYRKAVETDTDSNGSFCAMYALLALGERDKAFEFMEKVIADDPACDKNYYDAACLYAKADEPEKAIAYLRKALELGFKRYNLLMEDSDLNSIRPTPEFQALINEFFPSQFPAPAD